MLLAGALAVHDAKAQDCRSDLRGLADRHGIAIDASAGPQAEPTTPTAPATSESLGVGVMTRLEQPDTVSPRGPAGAEAGSTAPAPPVDAGRTEDDASRLRAEALLHEALAAADAGRSEDCITKLDAARPLLGE